MGFDLAGLPEPLRTRAVSAPGAAERLSTMIEEARTAHPALRFSDAAFAAHVLSRIPVDTAVTEHLAKLNAPDLLIAFACANGDRAGIAAFERRCFDEIPFAIARVRARATLDEIAQGMRDRLFVRSNTGPPKVVQYAGTGDLRGWFRVVLMRHLLNVVTRAPRETELDEAMLEALPANADPELEHVRRMYGPTLKVALLDAIKLLEPRERTLLRLAVCDALNVDAIGAMYGVHRATAARWVAAARERLEQTTRARARELLGANQESVDSLLRLLQSQLDVSLRSHLLSDSERS